MALTRITTWAEGNVLTAAALNAEFNNILNNATSLISPLTATLNVGLNEVTNLTLEKLPSDPAVVTTGRLFFDTARQSVKVGVSGTWTTGYQMVGPVGGLSKVENLSGSLISNIGSFAAQGYQMVSDLQHTIAVTATSSYSVDTQLAGPIANGRDQAAAFASTTVHFYAVSGGHRSTTIYGIVSTTPPPVGPAGQYYWTYLCSANYTVASSAMTQDSQIRGSFVSLTPSLTALNPGVGTGKALVETSVGVGTRVPQIATQYRMNVNAQAYGAVGDAALEVTHTVWANDPLSTAYAFPVVSWTGQNLSVLSSLQNAAWGIPTGSAVFDVPNLITPPSFYYSNSVVSGSTGRMAAEILGYTVPNGDN